MWHQHSHFQTSAQASPFPCNAFPNFAHVLVPTPSENLSTLPVYSRLSPLLSSWSLIQCRFPSLSNCLCQIFFSPRRLLTAHVTDHVLIQFSSTFTRPVPHQNLNRGSFQCNLEQFNLSINFSLFGMRVNGGCWSSFANVKSFVMSGKE